MKKLLLLMILVQGNLFAQDYSTSGNVEVPKSGFYDTDLLSKEFHSGRREALRNLMPQNSVAVLFSAPIRNRANDVDYEYHQDPNFYYYTGLNEPNSVVYIFKEAVSVNGKKVNEIIFIQDKDPSKEIWNGKRLGIEGVLFDLGIKNVELNSDYSKFPLNLKLFEGGVYYLPLFEDVKTSEEEGSLYNLQNSFTEKIAQKNIISNSENLQKWSAQLRQNKQAEELVLLKRAIDITCEAHNENMKMLKPNSGEYETEAVVEYIFKKNGAEYPGFPSIIGSGENTCILHYTTSRKTAFENELIVCDIGAEYHGYTADITRTLPVNGTFSEEQKIIYNIVLEAQQAGIDSCKVGKSFWSAHIAATTIISQRLKELGIITRPQEVRQYFMHGTSHYIGLDVHDAGTYGTLKPNDAITVEPGIYIPAGSPCDEKWWNIGVRIEDDILITEKGPILLSDSSPRTAEEIEKMMKEEPLIFK